MKDFEVHARGTTEEIRLSRELTQAIQQLIEQYGEGIIPNSIRTPYNRLLGQYMRQIQMENGQ